MYSNPLELCSVAGAVVDHPLAPTPSFLRHDMPICARPLGETLMMRAPFSPRTSLDLMRGYAEFPGRGAPAPGNETTSTRRARPPDLSSRAPCMLVIRRVGPPHPGFRRGARTGMCGSPAAQRLHSPVAPSRTGMGTFPRSPTRSLAWVTGPPYRTGCKSNSPADEPPFFDGCELWGKPAVRDDISPAARCILFFGRLVPNLGDFEISAAGAATIFGLPQRPRSSCEAWSPTLRAPRGRCRAPVCRALFGCRLGNRAVSLTWPALMDLFLLKGPHDLLSSRQVQHPLLDHDTIIDIMEHHSAVAPRQDISGAAGAPPLGGACDVETPSGCEQAACARKAHRKVSLVLMRPSP